jgi:Domain of unknown function (DUF4404)
MTKPENEDLRELLAELHKRLGHADTVDAESRTLLAEVSADIEQALGRSGSAGAAHESRLRELAVRFETEHPALAEALRDVVDALGRAGV